VPNVRLQIQNIADAPDAGAVDEPMELAEALNRARRERRYLVTI
jgi:hypothetical protein